MTVVRENAAAMTPEKRAAFLRALLTIKHTIANPDAPPELQISVYDQFIAMHRACLSVIPPGASSPLNYGHGDAGFLPWHREYLLRLERSLQQVDATVALPYWDWTDRPGSSDVVFTDTFMGPNGGNNRRGGELSFGYFSYFAPEDGPNTTVKPDWWQAEWTGWVVSRQLGEIAPGSGFGQDLERYLGTGAATNPFDELADQSYVDTLFEATRYDDFRGKLEGGTPIFPDRPPREQNKLHNFGHVWIGGNMSHPFTAVADPMFFLHHANIDRLWARWQLNQEHMEDYPATGHREGHNLGNRMWPWTGDATDYQTPLLQENVVLPNFADDAPRHPKDVLKFEDLGYTYDTLVD